MCPLLSPVGVLGTVLVCVRLSGLALYHSQRGPGLPHKCSGCPAYQTLRWHLELYFKPFFMICNYLCTAFKLILALTRP